MRQSPLHPSPHTQSFWLVILYNGMIFENEGRDGVMFLATKELGLKSGELQGTSVGDSYTCLTHRTPDKSPLQRCLTVLGKGQLVGRWVEGIVLAKAGRPHEAGLRANPLVWNAVKIPLHEWDRNEPVHPPSATIETLKIKSLKMHRLFKISQRR